ncbi:MAG TPA: type II toxin-antitoxin system HicA family toxin [Nannocystaceae bacterium]|nr:type II toxin-antitoxin system HicA family toxin [Nannocystaceae bacterium]
MGAWSATKASRVLAALLRIGWVILRQRGSHRRLSHPTLGLYTFAFHDSDEIGARMLARIGKATGLRPEDL